MRSLTGDIDKATDVTRSVLLQVLEDGWAELSSRTPLKELPVQQLESLLEACVVCTKKIAASCVN